MTTNSSAPTSETETLDRYADAHTGDPATFPELIDDPFSVEQACAQRRAKRLAVAWHEDFAAFIWNIAKGPRP